MRNEYRFFVYMMTNAHHSVIYTGVTNSLISRVRCHKNGESEFTNRYNCHNLVYYEEYGDIRAAIMREKRLKRWRRKWKIELIKTINPSMKDLYPELLKE